MNRIVTSVGLLALGASALHAAESSTLNSSQDTKAWSIQASLRGFYDDNVNATQTKKGSSGLEVAPSINFGMPGEQTSFNLGYGFSGRFYNRDFGSRSGRADYTHTFDANLSHAFNPTADVALNESFVIGQEPDTIRDPSAGGQRISGDNIRNFAGINFNVAATELLTFGFGYDNSFYDYSDDSHYAAGTLVLNGTATPPSTSALLDRLEHSVHLDSFWKLSPQTTAIVGYGFTQINYTGDETILGTVGFVGNKSDSRDSRIHTLSVGANHVFSPTLSGQARVGAQYLDQYGPTVIASGADNSSWSPYVLSSLTYALQTTTTVEAGFRYSRQAANTAGSNGNDFVRDTEVATIYGSLKHEIISKLIGKLTATYNDAKYNGGGLGFDGEHQRYYQLGVDLGYEFTQNFSGNIGYSFDKVKSTGSVGFDYSRNRFYAGLTAGF